MNSYKTTKKAVSSLCVLNLCCLLLFAACSGGGGGGGNSTNSTAGHTPFVVSKPVCLIGTVTGIYTHAGVKFTISNTTEKTVNHLTISCMVYADKTGTNPFIGTNCIKADFPETIAAGNTKTLYLDLSPYLYTIPTEPYLIDYFFIRNITFTDGSSWQDLTGTYAVRSW